MNEPTTAPSSPPAGSAARSSEAPTLGMSEQLKLRNAQQKTNVVLWGIFGLLLVLVAIVIFVLPGYLGTATPKVAAVPATPAAAVTATAPTPGLSPFEEAQRLRQREAAQTTLASLLEVQAALEARQVTNWAETAYSAALVQARSADDLYATQQFAKANELYQSALTALQKISNSQSAVFTEAMNAASAAYAAGSAVTAETAYRKALVLQPDSAEAASGLKRSLVLTQVNRLMNDGRSKQAAQQLEAARDAYQQAATLDAAYSAAATAVREMNTAIADRNFSAAMSRGYAALQADQYEQALAGFHQAQTMHPNASEVSAAIQQVNDKQTFASVNVHMAAAAKFEADENWQSAVEAWNQALAVDANLVKAQQGLKRSQSRNQLDTFLNATITAPLRLADDSVYKQAEQVLAEAGKLASAGTKLQGQLGKVRDFMARVRIPVQVQLQSDGQTKVTIFHVSELGLFTSQSVKLTPGTYTAVGIRNGYRDVRQEFSVSIDGQAPVVTVTCKEAI